MSTVQEGICATGNLQLKPMLHNQGFHKGEGTLRKELWAELEIAARTLRNSSTAGAAPSHTSLK